ncbi:hypothetical protein K491DRAFT_741288 [Lophiostoma macrostomum CBS 122681]|uniref:Uncharacterized protein n=1 Tax=Lophiostoma macrostomum CBS 122681 TaxID=1314788 RepID=A0A6A6TFN7_9PLEO|nr:hypothetical protein K491DRAFT_741288 [Lophiostoma macrostomum CBS 122681]
MTTIRGSISRAISPSPNNSFSEDRNFASHEWDTSAIVSLIQPSVKATSVTERLSPESFGSLQPRSHYYNVAAPTGVLQEKGKNLISVFSDSLKSPQLDEDIDRAGSTSELANIAVADLRADKTETPKNPNIPAPLELDGEPQTAQMHPTNQAKNEETREADMAKLANVIYEGKERLALLFSRELQESMKQYIEVKIERQSASENLDRYAFAYAKPLKAAEAVFHREQEQLDAIREELEEREPGCGAGTASELYVRQSAYNQATRKKETLAESYDAFRETDEHYQGLEQVKKSAEERHFAAQATVIELIEDACFREDPSHEEEEPEDADTSVVDEEIQEASVVSAEEEHTVSAEEASENQLEALDATTEDAIDESEDEEKARNDKLETAEWLVDMQKDRLKKAQECFEEYRLYSFEEEKQQFALDSGQDPESGELATDFGPVFLSKCMQLTKNIIREEELLEKYTADVRDLGGAVEDGKESNFGDIKSTCYDSEIERAWKMEVDRAYIWKWTVPGSPDGEIAETNNATEDIETVSSSREANDPSIVSDVTASDKHDKTLRKEQQTAGVSTTSGPSTSKKQSRKQKQKA